MPRVPFAVGILAGLLSAGVARAVPQDSPSSPQQPAAAQQPAAQDSPVFRSRADLLTVDVHVVDGDGNPVADVRPEEFTIRVDGRPRKPALADFVRYRLAPATTAPRPVQHAAPLAVPAAGLAAAHPAPTGRLVLIVVDEGNIRAGNAHFAIQSARQFVSSLDPADRVGLVTIPYASIHVEATTDRAKVLEGLDRIVGHYIAPERGAELRSLTVSEAFSFYHDANQWKRVVLVRECVEKEWHAPAPAGDCKSDMERLARTTVADARERRILTARSLAGLMDALAAIQGPKTLVLMSEGLPVAPYLAERADFNSETATISAAAARAQANVYVMQLHVPEFDIETRAEPSEWAGNTPDSDVRSFGLEAVATLTGGQRLLVSGRADAAFQRIARESSAYYLLGFEPEPGDRDGKAHSVTVSVGRKGLQVRARRQFVLRDTGGPGRLNADAGTRPSPAAPDPATPRRVPAVAAEPIPIDRRPVESDAPLAITPAPASPPAVPGLPGAATAPAADAPASDVQQLLARAGRYVVQYGEELSLIIGVEHYSQWLTSSDFRHPVMRTLVSEFALVRIPDDWLGFRDVFEVDGTAVRDRQDRLQKLLLDRSPVGLDGGRRLADESARYNMGAIQRNFNVPTTALFFLHPKNQARFEYKRDGEDALDGQPVWKVRYREKKRPSIIRTSAGRDMPVSGTFWVDPATGRVLKTHMEIKSATSVTSGEKTGSLDREMGTSIASAGPGVIVERTLTNDLAARRVPSSASITVTYKRNDRLALLVPVEMRETYEGAWAHPGTQKEALTTINCRATYDAFKRFETSGRVVQVP